ncbi:MAG: tetratricopeptide repeat protein, partial [Xanthomonadales bacterium]|nr:tetratricopeptide repeat protein [Xanthomonadales bacterium]
MTSTQVGAPLPALLQQASALHRQGRLAEAVRLFQQAVGIDGSRPGVWHELAYVYKGLGAFAEALQAFDQALALGIARPWEVQLDRAILCADHLRLAEQAREALQAALQLKPDYLPALLNLGNWYEQHGERQAALDCYRQILQLPHPQPVNLRYVALARSAVIDPPKAAEDSRLAELEQALTQVGPDPQVRPHLLFALGHSLDAVGRYDDAFEAYAKGNRTLLRASGRRHDRRQVEALTDAFIAAFPTSVSGPSGSAAKGPAPLFICGMFRSGSTLLEQVLAAHPQICAGGEIDWLLRTAAQRL